MKILLTFFFLATALLIICTNAHAQNGTADSLRRVSQFRQMKPARAEQKDQQRNYYKRTLKLDSLKAEKVAEIQENYKAGMKVVEADQSLNLETRKARIKALMEEKNSRLEALLDVGQQARIIPPGEPRRSKDKSINSNIKN